MLSLATLLESVMPNIPSDTFQRIFEHSSDLSSIHDGDGILLEISPACERLLGYTRDELIGNPTFPLFHEEDRYKIIKSYLTVTQGPSVDKVQYRIRHKEGHYLWFESTSSLMEKEDGPRIVSYTRDITRRKRTEQELELELKARKQLFSVVSHEMRNSFQALMIYSMLLTEDLEELDSEQIQDYANEIFISTVDVTELLNNMIDWMKLQRDDLMFDPEPIELKPLVEKVVNLYRNQSDKKEITYQYRLNEPDRAYADSTMCESILRNLISNAIKFSNQNGEITIELDPDPQRHMTRITIRDQGIGMSPDKAEVLFEGSRMFDPMERLAEDSGIGSGKGSVLGTGIGLTLCRDFIDKHSGDIWAESEPGKGTAVSFELPMTPEAMKVEDEP